MIDISNTPGVYAVINAECGKVYIGSTTNLKRRWREHRGSLCSGVHCNQYLQRAWDKYGAGAFEFGVLEYLEDPEELHLAEQWWMDLYREEGKALYNYSLAARSPWLGRQHSEESKRKMSEATRGRRPSEETRRKLSEINKGRKHTEETKRKISRAGMGHARNLGHTVSEETRRRMSKAAKGRIFSEEHRRNLSKAMTGRRLECASALGRARAKPYPPFYNKRTGAVIPAGINLSALCREQGLDRSHMCRVAREQQHSYKGWILA